MNSRTAVRKSFSASLCTATTTVVSSDGIRSVGSPAPTTRAMTFCANANAGWPVGMSSMQDIRADFSADLRSSHCAI